MTDPTAVKAITGKPYKGNSPKPHWLVQRATEVFGPCGIGWGIEVKDSQYIPTEAGVLHSATVRVWYDWQGKRGAVEHVGGTPASGKRKSGESFYDEDAAKKSVTDGMVKALSMIRFAADIFSGRWDDSKYQDEVSAHYAAPAERAAPPEEFKPATDPQIKMLVAEMVRAGVGWKRLLAHYKIESKDQVSMAIAEQMIADVKAIPTPAAKPAEASA